MAKTIDSQSIGAAYDEIADQWRDDRFHQDNGIGQHKRALGFLDENATGYALNVGCGCNTRFNSLFREHGLQVEGVDVSGRMIELARLADPEAILHQADICEWETSREYSFISAWDSIWHVKLSAQRPLMLKLMDALAAGGVFIFSAGGLDAPAEHTNSVMGPEVYYSTPGIPGILEVVSEGGCVLRHFEFDQYPETHLCVIVQKND